jgi:hypothetical protein
MPGLDGQIRIVMRPAPSTGEGRLPSCQCLGCDPHSQTATSLQGLVILAPVLYLKPSFRKFTASRFFGLL